MKKPVSFLTFVILLLISIPSRSQDVAIDFTQEECNGPSHHLFSELDAGKVVILDFVMLNCAPCIVGTNALETITKPYENSHPGRVVIYSFGFLNSYTCEQLLAWVTNNQFTHPVFNNGEEQVSYYGGMGMPTIVVVGTNEHKVFFKSIGYTPAMDEDIIAALDSALLYNPTGVEEKISNDRFKVYPTFFSGIIHVETDEDLAGSEVIISDSFGREVGTAVIPASGSLDVNSAGFSRGIYFIRLKGKHGISDGIKLIRQ